MIKPSEETIKRVLKSDNSEDFDVGYYMGIKSIRYHEQAKESFDNLFWNWEKDEKRHYSEYYDVEEPNKILTNKLLEHHYKDLRILKEYFYG